MKRVVHMTSVHSPDDGRIFAKECRTLAAAGYDVHLVAANVQDGVRDGVRIWGVTGRCGGRLSRMSVTVSRVYRRARALDGDLYHVHDPELVPAGLLLARSGAAVVYDVHEDLAATVLDKAWIARRLRPATSRLVAGIEPAASTRLAAVVAATPVIAQRFSGCEVVTVNNFPQLGEFQHVRRPAGGGEAVVCYAGGISAIRGIEEMVGAMALTDARLVLAGEFDPPELEDRVRASPGWPQVTYLGRVGRRRVAEIYATAAAGLVVLRPTANYVRSHPTKMFEYMASGLPVIASDFPLWREIVEGAGCGLCVDPSSREAVAGAIRWIVGHPDEARRMGENGRRAVASTYNWAPEGEKLTALYRTLLA
jgi:glycosyltransferase involved in cell wall biosynthesis